MEACALTDTGQKRSMNQDFIYASKKPIGSLENLFIAWEDTRRGISLPVSWWRTW